MKKRTITLAFDCYIGPIVGVAVDENGRFFVMHISSLTSG